MRACSPDDGQRLNVRVRCAGLGWYRRVRVVVLGNTNIALGHRQRHDSFPVLKALTYRMEAFM